MELSSFCLTVLNFTFDTTEQTNVESISVLDTILNILWSHAGGGWIHTGNIPNVNIWHHSSYHLKLAVNDLVYDIRAVCLMETLSDRLYALYVASSESRTELESVALEVSVKLYSTEHILCA